MTAPTAQVVISVVRQLAVSYLVAFVAGEIVIHIMLGKAPLLRRLFARVLNATAATAGTTAFPVARREMSREAENPSDARKRSRSIFGTSGSIDVSVQIVGSSMGYVEMSDRHLSYSSGSGGNGGNRDPSVVRLPTGTSASSLDSDIPLGPDDSRDQSGHSSPCL